VNAIASTTQTRLYVIVSVTIGLVLLWLAIRGADWVQLVETSRRAQSAYFLLSFVILTISYFIRGLRWRVLLSYVKPVAPLTAFWATMAGYLGNNFLPARAGELLRTHLIGRSTGMSRSFVLATALVERVGDFLFLVAVGFVTTMFVSDSPRWMVQGSGLIAAFGLAGIAFVVIAPRIDKQIKTIFELLPVPARWLAGLSGLIDRFLLGLATLHDPRRALGFTTLMALTWLTDAAAAMAVARAFDLPLTLLETLILLAALGLSSAVPSTPGSVGVYQFVTVGVLVPFGFTSSDALVFIVAFQAVIYLSVVIWGGAGTLWLNR
jgi:uncharacterized protein (TIRG00374 family)